MKSILFVLAFIASTVAVADDGSIADSLQKFFDMIPTEGSYVLVFGTLLEFVFRLMKTDKPKSVIYMVADLLKVMGAGMVKLGSLSDKVLPQRLK